jgi:outer membrane protein assembly factor BamD (BamD/ComL family)
MAKKVTRKELLKGSDEFLTLSSRVAEYFRTHLRQLKIFGLAVAVVLAAYLAVQLYLSHVNRKAQIAYDAAYDTFTENLKPEAKAEDLQKAENQFKAVVEEYGLSKVARLALPQVAFVNFLDQKYDSAVGSYRKFSKGMPKESSFQSLTDLAVAACYESKGDFSIAIETLNPLLKRPDDPFKENIMFNLARLYRLNNQHEKAKEISKEFIEKYQDSPFLPMVKAYL